MMGDGDNVMLRLGGAMFEATEEEATEYCEAEVERQQEILDKLSEEEAGIVERQETLKKLLYGRFGKSINLEAWGSFNVLSTFILEDHGEYGTIYNKWMR